jgi:hypothetical protein
MSDLSYDLGRIASIPVGLTEIEFGTYLDRLDAEQTPTQLVAAGVSPTTLSENDGFRRIANSEVWTYKRCRRRWMFAYYRRLRPRVESPVGPRAIGNRVHRALARWYVPETTTRTDPRDALERLIVEDWTEVTGGIPSSVDPDTRKRFDDDASLERVMLDGYVQWVAETGADHEYTVLGPEEYRETEVPGLDNTKIIARIDARVRRISDGARMLLEHKTTGAFSQLVHGLPLDEQTQWQLLVERSQEDEDGHVGGTLYNMLRRVRRTPRATPPFYMRVEVHRSPVELDHFRTRVVGTVLDIDYTRGRLDDGADHRMVAYPTPTHDCQWQCPFFAVCGMVDDGSRYEDALGSLYVEDDPLGYYVRDQISPAQEEVVK